MGTWDLIGIYFQKLPWFSITAPSFRFLAYPYPETWVTGKSDPIQAYADFEEPKLNRFNPIAPTE